ncbi:MAG TPA: response regulator [Candidatus Limnocylindria bacterium]|nr:response regulator [Candidatus Limnocylindria bacterium]
MATVLLLDDDPIVLELLGTVLEDAGYKPITAARLDEVPAGTRADLVVSDLIPLKAYSRETALEWVSALRERFRPAPILVVTAHGAALAEPDRLGAGGILGKPFDVEALLTKVAELLGAGGETPTSGVGGQRPPPVTS